MAQTTMRGSLAAALDPRGQPLNPAQSLALAPRLGTLDHKTVYLVDVGFAGGYEFLEQMRNWFSEHRPTVEIVLKRKPGNMFMDAPQLWAEIKEQADAVVFGVGG